MQDSHVFLLFEYKFSIQYIITWKVDIENSGGVINDFFVKAAKNVSSLKIQP